MPQIEIPIEPIENGRSSLAREVERLEKDGKQIREIQYPGWANYVNVIIALIWMMSPVAGVIFGIS